MALPVNVQLRYWGIGLAIFAVLLWYLGNVLMPFVIGGALAYCLDPFADRLEKMGLSRIAATVVITIFAILLFVVLALLVFPLVVQQAIELVRTAPTMVNNLSAFLVDRFPSLADEQSTIRQSLADIATMLQSQGGDLLNTVINSALSLLNVVVLIVLVPVITFYLLLDWDRMVARVNDLLPLDHAPVIRDIFGQIDKTLASFIRGQGTVCLILGTYYAAALMLVGLQFGLIVGFIAGLITFIPYVGALVGGALAIGLALFQFWGDWVWIAAVAAIFMAGQFVEGNILTPNLVGSSVGLHPVWLILALSVFGAIFGFIGMLVAVPVAAVIGVVARFLIARYKEGRLYKGQVGRDLDEV